MITGKNLSKILTKDIPCECKCKFDGRKCNSDQKWNKNQFLFFTCIFINYYSIIDSCYYLLLSDKIASKTKTFITTSRHK